MNISNHKGFNPCIVIPVYNHVAVLSEMLAFFVSKDLAVIVVDDGSDAQYRNVMEKLPTDFVGVHLFTHTHNRGKGAAVKTGLFEAHKLHFTHALQIDADGQHDLSDVIHFIDQSRAHPEALIAGHPVYDESVPKIRFYGRYLSHVWVWINTLSTTIIDSMCGFRVYPLQESCALLTRCRMGDRMEFDGEFIVRWCWEGHALVQLPTRVIYPVNGSSHFRLWRDNMLISLMHARLFLLMLLRLPRLLVRKYLGTVRRTGP